DADLALVPGPEGGPVSQGGDMRRNTFTRTMVAAAATISMLTLAACGGGSDDPATTGGGGGSSQGGDTIKVGFSQLGAESGWRTANTESVKANLTKENGFDLTFVDAQQKQE